MHPFLNQIRVTYDDESVPEEFERVSRDLAKGGVSGRRAYLWLKRQQSQQGAATTLDLRRRNNPGNNDSEGAQSVAATEASHIPSCPASSTLSATQDRDIQHHSPPQLPQSDAETSAPLPIGEVVVAFGSSDPNVEEAEVIRQQERGGASENGGEGKGSVRVWERLERSLDPAAMEVVGSDSGGEPQGGAAVFLWYRRGSEDDSGSWSSHSLKVRAILTGVGSISSASQNTSMFMYRLLYRTVCTAASSCPVFCRSHQCSITIRHPSTSSCGTTNMWSVGNVDSAVAPLFQALS